MKARHKRAKRARRKVNRPKRPQRAAGILRKLYSFDEANSVLFKPSSSGFFAVDSPGHRTRLADVSNPFADARRTNSLKPLEPILKEQWQPRGGHKILLDALTAGLSPIDTAERIFADCLREDVLFGAVVFDEEIPEDLRLAAEARADYSEIVRELFRLAGLTLPAELRGAAVTIKQLWSLDA